MTIPSRDASASVGDSIGRLDGKRFVTGAAKYVDDIDLPEQLHLAFARSPFAHAVIENIDTSAIDEIPGVRGAVTGAELEAHTNPIATETMGRDGDDQYGLAVDRVRYFGEPVAAVAATSKYVAEDAAERIDVSYEPLDPVVTVDDALADEPTLVHPEIQRAETIQGNVSDRVTQDVGDVERGFEAADTVFQDEFRFPALSAAPLETHGCIADFEAVDGTLTLYSSTQVSHRLKENVARIFELPSSRVQVIQPEIGGGFGNKIAIRPHEICAVYLSQKLDRPVKAKLSRSEHFETTTASFDYRMKLELGIQRDGTITAWDEEIIQDGGAYHLYGLRKPGLNVTTLPYKVPNVRLDARAVYTNRVPSGVVRGVGYRQLSFAREVLLSRAAKELGIDPIEIRLRQAVTNDDCPYETAIGHRIGSSGVAEAFDLAKKAIDYETTKRRVESKKHLGIGVGCAMHITSCKYETNPPDYGTVCVELEPDGSLELRTEACDMGTGIRTTLAQIASDILGVTMEDINVLDGDTDKTPPGLGSWGSRTLSVVGSATHKAATEVREQLATVAAERLRTLPEELVFVDGRITASGSGSSVDIVDAADAIRTNTDLPDGIDPGPIRAERTFESRRDSAAQTRVEPMGTDARGNFTLSYPVSVQIATVAVDESTGRVDIRDLVVVDDAGNAVNPQIVHGQGHGGAAQAVGSVLGEALRIDETTGRMTNGTFAEYPMPSTAEVPDVTSEIVEIPSPNTPGGWKGVGEGAFVSGPCAIANAISDAVGEPVRELPLDPETVKSML